MIGNPNWMINGLLSDVLLMDDDVLSDGDDLWMFWMELEGNWGGLHGIQIVEISTSVTPWSTMEPRGRLQSPHSYKVSMLNFRHFYTHYG